MIDSRRRQSNDTGEWSGQKIGGYHFDTIIGQGAMSTVYRAYQEQLERWVAIKVLKRLEPPDRSFLLSFRREARAIAALRHPNILTVYDYGEEEGRAYIVVEHVAGGTLRGLIDDQPKPWREIAGVILPVAHALAYAHSHGIIHCDVKPSNVLLSRPDWPLLADFGLLRMQNQETAKPGTLSGTPTYASPEQIVGETLTAASDIYSLGLILYQLRTGRLPFTKIASSSMILQRLLEYPVPPSVSVPDVNPDLERIILKTLARTPTERYESMDNLISELMQLPGNERSYIPQAPADRRDRTNSTQSLSERPPAQGAHLVITGTGTVLSLPVQEVVVVGRNSTDDDEPPEVDLGPHGAIQAGVSRHHARLRYAAEGWLLEDLESTNGTSLNGTAVEPGELYRLDAGDVIHCGRLMLVFFDK